MDFATFQSELNAVKYFSKDEDYEAFDRLTDTVRGDEGIEWLSCLLDAVCAEEDNGPYEGLCDAIWRFPQDMVGWRLAEYLPYLQRRMEAAPFQVWRFYIFVPREPASRDAFIAAARHWNEEDRELGMKTIIAWSMRSAREEAQWAPVLQALGYEIPQPGAQDPVPAHWPEELQDKLHAWRELPPDDTSKRVFWESETSEGQWKGQLPCLVEALALSQGAKWRDIKVWLNPLGTFAIDLYDDFVRAFLQAPPEVQENALRNIQRVRPALYEELLSERQS